MDNAATLQNLPNGFAEPEEFTDEQRAIAGNKIFRKLITVWHHVCFNCGHEFYGEYELNCPLCGCTDLDDSDPKDHEIWIYSNTGEVEVR